MYVLTPKLICLLILFFNKEFKLQIDERQAEVVSVICGGRGRRFQTSSGGNVLDRYRSVSERYEAVCDREAEWEKKLQIALVVCSDFHRTADDMQSWLDSMQADLRTVQNACVLADKATLRSKYCKLKVRVYTRMNTEF